jgi:hypothetical protein
MPPTLLRHRQGRVECVAQEPGGITGSTKMSDGDWLDDGFVLGTDQKSVGAEGDLDYSEVGPDGRGGFVINERSMRTVGNTKAGRVGCVGHQVKPLYGGQVYGASLLRFPPRVEAARELSEKQRDWLLYLGLVSTDKTAPRWTRLEGFEFAGESRRWGSLFNTLRTQAHEARSDVLARKPAGIVLNEHTDEDGATVFRHACKLGFEGIVSKRLSAPYRSGASRDWIKAKNPDSPAMLRAREGRW